MKELLPAQEGAGPLLQRDYWGVIRDCRVRPSELILEVSAGFPSFSPSKLAEFTRVEPREGPLTLGEELEVHITMAGTVRVRVLHQDTLSFTLGTLEGHPEAGRITFGAYRNRRRDVIFHIRSRARSGTKVKYVGFLAAGDAMQTETWGEFVNRVGCTFGEGIIGAVYADRKVVPDESALKWTRPTYVAKGD